MIFLIIVLFNVDSIEQDLSFSRIVQAAQQLNKGRFSGTIFSYQCKLAAYFEFERNVVENLFLCSRISKGNIPKLQFILIVVPLFYRKLSLILFVLDGKEVDLTL